MSQVTHVSCGLYHGTLEIKLLLKFFTSESLKVTNFSHIKLIFDNASMSLYTQETGICKLVPRLHSNLLHIHLLEVVVNTEVVNTTQC